MEYEDDFFAEGVMEMPTPCQHCNGIFDLNDGSASEKWYPNTIICESCGRREEEEIERDNEIEELRERYSNAKWEIEDARNQLIILGVSDIDDEKQEGAEKILPLTASESVSLTKENFWNELNERLPAGTKVFCDWIDEYKERLDWSKLFNAGYVLNRHYHIGFMVDPGLTLAPKFHDLPYAFQLGIWIQFVLDRGGCAWEIDYMFSFDLREEIEHAISMIDSEQRKTIDAK